MTTSGIKILVIDDDPAVLALLAHLLADLATIEIAQGGLAGLSMAAKLLPDLIICDVDMPDVSGLTICRHMRGDILTKSIPVICMSASTNEEEEIAALRAGAVDFIKKPLSPMIVRARISTQIELCQKSEMLLEMARRDPLTGIFNRRYFEERLADEWARHRRAKEALTIGLFDAGNLRTMIPPAGFVSVDTYLMAVADRLRNAARRPGELAARFGGEDFIMLLPRRGVDDAKAFGHWICAELQTIQPNGATATPAVDIRVGLASVVPDDALNSSDIIRMAHEALLRARDNVERYAVMDTSANALRRSSSVVTP